MTGAGLGYASMLSLVKAIKPAADEYQKAEQNDQAAGQPECQHALDHRSSSGLIKPAATALIAASARVVARSLMRALLMWKSTVRLDRRSFLSNLNRGVAERHERQHLDLTFVEHGARRQGCARDAGEPGTG